MPPINTDKNTNYGPPLVSQKYSPLLNIGFDRNDTALYSALLTNRMNLLTAAGLLPQPLALVTPNWATIIAAEAGKSPPLVVISSNRSDWISTGIEAANQQLEVLPGSPAAFANASDLNALTALAGQTVSPPIYCPKRIGAAPLNRNVYVVVHAFEYLTYKTALQNTGITVVGWQFQRPASRENLAGFGASRYAAIEFCKELRTAAAGGGAAPWDYAWLFDDNVVALTNFPGFAAAEAAMTAQQVCAGFRGGTKAEAFQANRDWARGEIAAGRGGQAAGLPASQPPGIIQQAALWNINYLATNNLNFSPIYITSGEDLSFGNYFDTQPIPYFYYEGIGVRKEEAYSDGEDGGKLVNKARLASAKRFADAEISGALMPLPPLPPPVAVQPSNAGDGGVQTLGAFIANYVLPNSQMRDQAGNAGVQNTAKCQGVEQITCGAIANKFVTSPATTFQVAIGQVIVRRDVP